MEIKVKANMKDLKGCVAMVRDIVDAIEGYSGSMDIHFDISYKGNK